MDDEAQAETEAETDTEAPSDGCRRPHGAGRGGRRHRIIRSRPGSQQQQLTPESGKPNRKRTEHGPRLLPLSACPKASTILASCSDPFCAGRRDYPKHPQSPSLCRNLASCFLPNFFLDYYSCLLRAKNGVLGHFRRFNIGPFSGPVSVGVAGC